LVHIATDGETYGHHHRYGEMALTYALRQIQSNQSAELTNYGQYLERHPADHFVEIFDNTSWSWVHGVERWRSHCGCNSGGHPEWNQEWRGPLRAALDWLRDAVAGPYAAKSATLLKHPWAARDSYIEVILDRSAKNVDRFFSEQARHALDEHEQITALKLLELQRNALLMYTSCGWFFDELSGIETVQVIHYAGRVVRLAQELFGGQIEQGFLERLEGARSNIPEHRDGARIYEKWVKPANTDLTKAAAHYAISSMFEPYGDHSRIYCYDVYREDYNAHTEGKTRLAIGRARVTSEITRESSSFSFGVLHLGGHNVWSGVRTFSDHEYHQCLVNVLTEAFAEGDATEVTRLLEAGFDRQVYSLKSLFRDEQRKIVSLVLEETLAETASAYRNIFHNHAPLIGFLSSLGIPPPRAFQAAAEVALNSQLREAFKRPELDLAGIRSLLKEAGNLKVPLEVETLEFVIRKRVEEGAAQLASRPGDVGTARRLNRLLDLVRALPFPVSLWEAQNAAYLSLSKAKPALDPASEQDASLAASWAREAAVLREKLGLQILEEVSAG
jgi:alpha-amylase/alpha-mannosidase (GH57 family)